MVDLEILEKHGCTQARLREIFTAEKGTDRDVRENFQDLIQSRIIEGIRNSVKNSKLYMSVDIAWDSLPINKATIPLLQYAQGKITVDQCHDSLDDLKVADQFCEYDDEGKLKTINTLRLYEVSVNLIRSYVTRRVAAQVHRFSNLYPYFKYESRSTSLEDKLRADVLSQRVEMMTDQFGYRHLWEQAIRQMFMYGHSVAFPETSWSEEVQWRKTVDELTGEEKLESYTERGGVKLKTPHPTRVVWDQSRPLHDLNINQGPEWIGYWDIIRYGDIKDNPSTWNSDKISYTNSLHALYSDYADYFNYYFTESMAFPRVNDQYPFHNERTQNTGVYSSEDTDKGMFVTNMYMRVNPKRDGLGDYPHEVWLKLTVASDETVIHAEYMPSLPAIYGGINENDDRMANISVAHEIMPFQDQLSNIMTKMLHDMKVSMMRIFCIDQDALDDDVKEYIKDGLSEDTFYSKPKALFYSGQKAADLGINNNNFIQIVDAQKELSAGINQSIQAILQLLNLVERLLILSPQELGQPAPREISATEVAEIANTTNSIYSFISEGIDDMRAAAKKLFYEHLVSCSTDKFVVPIKQRYTDRVIRDAGFESETEGEFEAASRNVIGTPANLIHEYLFSSRDGAERARDTQSAQVLGQALANLLQIEGMMQMLGKDRMFEIMNEVFRMSGAHDLKLQTDEADQQQEIGSMQNEQFLTKLKQEWPQVLQAVEKLIDMAQGGGQPQSQPQPPAGREMPPREAPPQPDQQPKTSPDQQVML
jgi:hypothetical protein